MLQFDVAVINKDRRVIQKVDGLGASVNWGPGLHFLGSCSLNTGKRPFHINTKKLSSS